MENLHNYMGISSLKEKPGHTVVLTNTIEKRKIEQHLRDGAV